MYNVCRRFSFKIKACLDAVVLSISWLEVVAFVFGRARSWRPARISVQSAESGARLLAESDDSEVGVLVQSGGSPDVGNRVGNLKAVPVAACGVARAAPAEESVVPHMMVAGKDEEPLHSAAPAADAATDTMPPAAA